MMTPDTTDQDDVASPNMAAVAYERILDLILSHDLPGGAVVQERLLAKQLNLSRTPIREAINRLEGQDLLRRTSPRMLSVSNVTIEDAFEILAVRRILESEAVVQTARQGTLSDVDAIIDAVEAIRVRANVTAEDHRLLDNRVHESIAHASGNHTLAKMIAQLRRKTEMFDMRRIPERFASSCEEHLRILRAIRSRDGDGARREMVQHLENTRSGILNHLGGMAR